MNDPPPPYSNDDKFLNGKTDYEQSRTDGLLDIGVASEATPTSYEIEETDPSRQQEDDTTDESSLQISSTVSFGPENMDPLVARSYFNRTQSPLLQLPTST